MMVVMSACGKEVDNTRENILYPTETYIVKGEQGYLTNLISNGNYLYAGKTSYLSGGSECKTWICKYDLKENLQETVLLEIWNQVMLCFAINDDGTIEVVTKEVDVVQGELYFINLYNNMGEIVQRTNISEQVNDNLNEGYTLNNVLIDTAKNVYLLLSNKDGKGNSLLVKVSDSGEMQLRVSFSGKVNQAILAQGESVFFAYQDEMNYLKFGEIDTLENHVILHENDFVYSGECNNLFLGMEPGIMYFCTSETMYQYNVEQKNMMSFSMSELAVDDMDIYSIVQIEEGIFGIAVNEYNYEENQIDSKLLVVTSQNVQVGDEEYPEEKELVIAIFNNSDNIKSAVKEFNKNNTGYRAVVKTYNLDADGLSLLHADIGAGNIPDVIDVGGLDLSVYIKKGIITDLSPFIEMDTDIKRKDFCEQALETYSVDNKLYAMPTVFWISTMVAKTKNLQGISGWNMEEFEAFIDTLDMQQISSMTFTKEEIFRYMIEQYAGEYIDWREGKCNFDNNNFVALLELSNRFKGNSESYDKAEEMERIQQDKVILFPMIMNSPLQYLLNRTIANDDVTYVGYPSKNGSGTKLIMFGNVYAITEQCENKEEAWELVKSLCTQKNLYLSGFPVYKEQLERTYEFVSMKTYEADNNELYKFQIPYGNEMLEVPAASDEEIEQLRSLIQNAEKADIRYPEIYDILSEEAFFYFNGQRSAEEVAGLMQNRVQLYLDENN